ncbi:MAG: CehA/McbA family metallohydrolase [Bullifex sp.]
MRNTFTHHVPKEREGKYYTVDFTLPSDSDRLTVFCAYERKDTCIDLGLMDPDGRFIGWSGSSRESVYVSAHDSTPGYLMTDVRKGVWKIIVGAYHVPSGGTDVTYTVETSSEGDLWLKCDLHMHSTASDGQYSVYQLAEKAVKLGLDVISVTDHNNWSENLTLPKISGLTIIPGVEWTHYRGHMNFWGIKEAFRGSFVANSEKEMRSLVADAKSRGATVGINHPRCTICPYLWESDELAHTVEVWNGPMRHVNEMGIDYFFSLIAKGRRIALVGGSDYHRDRGFVRMGNPVTVVHSSSRSQDDILSAVREGRSYVTKGVNGPFLHFDSSGHSFGERVSKGAAFTVRAEALPPFSYIEAVFSDGRKVRAEREIKGVLDADWVYVRAVRKYPFMKEWILAVSNPVYGV